MNYEDWELPTESEAVLLDEAALDAEVLPVGTSPPDEGSIPQMQQLMEALPEESASLTPTEDAPVPQKPKRAPRKKRAAAPAEEVSQVPVSIPRSEEIPVAEPDESRSSTPKRQQNAPILTIHAKDEVQTEDAKEDYAWHQISSAFYTRKILSGILGGVEQTDSGQTLAIVDYKGFRVIIPLKEMMVVTDRRAKEMSPRQLLLLQSKILGSMLGCEVDFMVKGIDKDSRSIVGSRKDAMLRKRQIFYVEEAYDGLPRIHAGRIVQARVIGVSEKVVRVEAFGVECPIVASNISWEWIGDARDKFHIGDQVLVRVTEIQKDDVENISIKADMKSIYQNNSRDNLRKCRIQSKYAGKVTDIHKGIVYVRLSNGVNAIAHTCLDFRMPGKKDDVSFAVTRLDEDRGVAVGIITRIIRQNL